MFATPKMARFIFGYNGVKNASDKKHVPFEDPGVIYIYTCAF